MKWIRESLGTSIDGTSSMQMHVIEVVAVKSAGLLGFLFRLLVATNFRVHSTGCWTRKGRVECVIYVEGARTGTLLWEIRRDMKYFRISTGHLKIIVHRVAAEESFDLKRRLHNLKSMDLTRPRSSSNIRVEQRKECEEGFLSADVVVCVGKSEPLVHVSGTLADLNYKIWQASIEYPGPYKFLKGKARKCEDFDVGTRGNEEMGNMKRILDVAIERGCSEVNVGLSVRGPSEELHDDLMRSLRENGLFVTGGQFYRDYHKLNSCLHFFVSELPAAGAG